MAILIDELYATDAVELAPIATRQTLSNWRSQGRGPAFIKVGSKVLYRGSDLLKWLEANRVEVSQ